MCLRSISDAKKVKEQRMDGGVANKKRQERAKSGVALYVSAPRLLHWN